MAFVPRTPVTLTVRNVEGVERSLAGQGAPVLPSPAELRHGSPGMPNRRPTSVRIESEDQWTQRLSAEKKLRLSG